VSDQPYRDLPFPVSERTRELERENADLRRLVFALVLAILVMGGLAGWWFSLAWRAIPR
jgi:hypothetical protein